MFKYSFSKMEGFMFCLKYTDIFIWDLEVPLGILRILFLGRFYYELAVVTVYSFLHLKYKAFTQYI